MARYGRGRRRGRFGRRRRSSFKVSPWRAGRRF